MGLIPANAAVRSSRGVRWAMAATALAVLAADQVSKTLVLAAHPAPGTAAGWLSIRLVRNTGASGGIASGYPVLVTLAAIAVTAIAAAFALHARSRAAALCLAAVLGGATGNLADRIFRAPGFGRGGVVDWIHFGPGGGSMDIADLAIQFGVIGAVIAILASERVRRAAKAGKATGARASADDGCRLPGPMSAGEQGTQSSHGSAFSGAPGPCAITSIMLVHAAVPRAMGGAP
jgi:signal peptidase II